MWTSQSRLYGDVVSGWVVLAFVLAAPTVKAAPVTRTVPAMASLPGTASPSLTQTEPLQIPIDTEQLAEPELPETSAEEVAAPPLPPLKLEKPDQDPLLPGQVKGRSLTPIEQQRLRLGLERLTEEADSVYTSGDRASAYQEYFHILGLSQYLPAGEELTALADVGDRAWRDSRSKASQLITERLTALAGQTGEKLSNTNRLLLAEAYERSGAWTQSIAQYEMLLLGQQSRNKSIPNNLATDALTSGNAASSVTEADLVNRLAQLNMLRLNYSVATTYTEQALAFATTNAISASNGSAVDNTNPNPLGSPISPQPEGTLPLPSQSNGSEFNSRSLLTQLAYLYEQEERFAEAAEVQQQLLPLYGSPLDLKKQPALQVAIAQNQAQAGLLTEAIESYQTAYRQAQTFQQFAVSHDALAQLGALYRQQTQPDDALAVYDILLQVDELSYNLYGLTDTHVSRAEILLEQEQTEQAKQAYRQALHSAQLLGYRVEELEQKLAELI